MIILNFKSFQFLFYFLDILYFIKSFQNFNKILFFCRINTLDNLNFFSGDQSCIKSNNYCTCNVHDVTMFGPQGVS
jgi:hypothetical protein